MSSRQIRSNKTTCGNILAIFLVIFPCYSVAANCLWINDFCRSNDCPKYPDLDSALDVMTEDAWLFHTTNSGTCVYHNGAYGTPSSYQITSQTCENRQYSDLPSRCARVVTFYYSDGAYCNSVVEHASVWSCDENQKQYIIKLEPSNGVPESQIFLKSIKPDESIALIASVYDQNNQLVPNVDVRLTLEAKQDSGGHHHVDDTVVARTGTLAGQQVLTGNTEANGLQFSYKAPSVSGDYKIVASCTDGKNCTQEGPDTAWVGIKGLEPIIPASDPASGPLYVLIGQDNYHPNNHYLTPQANGRLQQLATLYQQRFPDKPPLHLNDASLERGGLFDIYWGNPTKGNKRTIWWTPPHREHRRGTVIDVRANQAAGAIPDRPDTRQYFEQLVLDIRGSFILESQGTSNEHYHIRLMGAAE